MEKKSSRKYRIGYVTSDKMDKTVVVSIVELIRHPLYSKAVKRTTKYKAHDEQNACKIGDKVRIGETRPLSKEKRWEVIQILEKAAQ